MSSEPAPAPAPALPPAPAPAPAPAPEPAPVPLNVEAPAAPLPIATISELTSSQNAILVKEKNDKSTLSQLSNPNRNQLRIELLKWTARGFPANFTILTLSIVPPNICADGVKRSFVDYVQYLLGTSISAQLALLQPQLEGIRLSYTVSSNKLYINVTK